MAIPLAFTPVNNREVKDRLSSWVQSSGATTGATLSAPVCESACRASPTPATTFRDAKHIPPTTPEVDAPTSDPVDIASGEFVHRSVDLELPSTGVPFRHIRVYRSRIEGLSAMGTNWDLSYNQRILPAATTGASACNEAVFHTGDGSEILFKENTRTGTPSGSGAASAVFTAPNGITLRLAKVSVQAPKKTMPRCRWTTTRRSAASAGRSSVVAITLDRNPLNPLKSLPPRTRWSSRRRSPRWIRLPILTRRRQRTQEPWRHPLAGRLQTVGTCAHTTSPDLPTRFTARRYAWA